MDRHRPTLIRRRGTSPLRGPARGHVLRRLLGVGAAVALATAGSGCLELIRRPAADAAPPPFGEAAGPRPRARAASAADDTLTGQAARTPILAAAAKRPGPDAGPTTAGTAAASAPRQPRSAEARQRVRQVNEYVYWCLERDLWDEARIHLEQALARDSLAASLHNNLAIVWEKQGRPEEAARAYERAWELDPKKLYSNNLERLRQRLEAADEPAEPDSLRVEHERVGAGQVNPHEEAGADSVDGLQTQR